MQDESVTQIISKYNILSIFPYYTYEKIDRTSASLAYSDYDIVIACRGKRWVMKIMMIKVQLQLQRIEVQFFLKIISSYLMIKNYYKIYNCIDNKNIRPDLR